MQKQHTDGAKPSQGKHLWTHHGSCRLEAVPSAGDSLAHRSHPPGAVEARFSRLAELGHELRRPEADYLRDDIYELRVRYGNVNYRILYFFHGRRVAILSHLITKEDKVPDVEIDRAVRNLRRFEANPEKHTYPGLSKGERS